MSFLLIRGNWRTEKRKSINYHKQTLDKAEVLNYYGSSKLRQRFPISAVFFYCSSKQIQKDWNYQFRILYKLDKWKILDMELCIIHWKMIFNLILEFASSNQSHCLFLMLILIYLVPFYEVRYILLTIVIFIAFRLFLSSLLHIYMQKN